MQLSCKVHCMDAVWHFYLCLHGHDIHGHDVHNSSKEVRYRADARCAMHIAAEMLQGLCRYEWQYNRPSLVNLVQQGLSTSNSGCNYTRHLPRRHVRLRTGIFSRRSLTVANSRDQNKIHNTSYGRQHVALASHLHFSSIQAKQLGRSLIIFSLIIRPTLTAALGTSTSSIGGPLSQQRQTFDSASKMCIS